MDDAKQLTVNTMIEELIRLRQLGCGEHRIMVEEYSIMSGEDIDEENKLVEFGGCYG